jgi:ArsR family transcriptional regulator
VRAEQYTGGLIAFVQADLFKAIAHQTRVRALEVLSAGPRAIGEFQSDLGIEPAHLSQQFAVLRRAGLVAVRKEKYSVVYSIKDPVLIDLLGASRQFIHNSPRGSGDLLSDLDPRQ